MKKNIISATMIGTKVNVFINGAYHQKDFGTTELALDFLRLVQKAKTDETAIEEVKNALNKLHKIQINENLERDASGNVYLKGTDTPMPSILTETMLNYIEAGLELDPLIKFWKLCLINPDRTVRNDLFKFLSTYQFTITDEGMFIAYKAVTHKELVDEDLIAFISNQWLKIKKWKKAPKNHTVIDYVEKIMVEGEDEYDEEWIDDEDHEDGGYYEEVLVGEGEPYEVDKITRKVIETEELERLQAEGKVAKVLGNLEEMYKNIEKMLDEVDNTLYTDKHTRTMEIRVGLPVKQERRTCDKDPRNECSNGLHVGSTKYVEHFGNGNDSVLACLVNPMNVIAVPNYDNSKMRVCEYFPFAKLEKNADGTFETMETNYFESDYINIEKKTLEKLYYEMLENENPLEYESSEEIKEKIELIKQRLVDISNEE